MSTRLRRLGACILLIFLVLLAAAAGRVLVG
jgi:hypothetical protein